MDQGLDEAQKKAEVLIEALPYIQKFNRKIIVVKYGGSAMSDEELQRHVIQDVTLLKLVGFKPIIVHGGGKAISSWVQKTGKEAQFINGLRVTDKETMEIAEMVLGRVSKNLVTMVEELGVKAVGISGKDSAMLKVKKRLSGGQDIGYVGEITKVDPKILFDMMDHDYLPIVAPIGLDDQFETYNINADAVAGAVAGALRARRLIMLTDVAGVLDPEGKLIQSIRVEDAAGLYENGTVTGGMIPKLNCCIDAIEQGVEKVMIVDGRVENCVLLELLTDQGVGTEIVGEER